MLRKDQVEFHAPGGQRHHPLQKKWVGQIFEIAQLRITPHLPGREQMQPDAELFRYAGGVGDLRTKHMHRMAAPDHFLDQINGLRRPAPRGRIKRFVRQKRNHELGR